MAALMPPEPVVAVETLRWTWRHAHRPLLDIPALTLAPGETLFLHGASGSGKSTLLALLAGVLTVAAGADRGAVKLLGRAWAAMPAAHRDRFRADHVGFVFQQFNLLGYLPVIDNVLLPCRFSQRRAVRAAQAAGSARTAAERLLERMGLGPDLWGRPASRLSLGQQQRVAAARALIGAPELLLADEPTSALDETRRDEFMDLLLGARAAAGSALVFVSHDARLAARFSRRFALAESSTAAPGNRSYPAGGVGS